MLPIKVADYENKLFLQKKLVKRIELGKCAWHENITNRFKILEHNDYMFMDSYKDIKACQVHIHIMPTKNTYIL